MKTEKIIIGKCNLCKEIKTLNICLVDNVNICRECCYLSYAGVVDADED